MMRRRIMASMVALVLTTPALHYLRGLDWPLALIGGLALSAFAFLLVRAIQNLAAWRPRQ